MPTEQEGATSQEREKENGSAGTNSTCDLKLTRRLRQTSLYSWVQGGCRPLKKKRKPYAAMSLTENQRTTQFPTEMESPKKCNNGMRKKKEYYYSGS